MKFLLYIIPLLLCCAGCKSKQQKVLDYCASLQKESKAKFEEKGILLNVYYIPTICGVLNHVESLGDRTKVNKQFNELNSTRVYLFELTQISQEEQAKSIAKELEETLVLESKGTSFLPTFFHMENTGLQNHKKILVHFKAQEDEMKLSFNFIHKQRSLTTSKEELIHIPTI